MKKYLAVIVAISFLAFPALSIAAQNFTGSWVRDSAKSDPAPNAQYWLTRDPNSGGAGGGGGRGNVGGGRGGGGGGRGNAGGGGAPTAVTMVQQDGNTLTVTSPSGAVQKYTLDGKPFSKPTDTGVAKATVSAIAQGDTLVITTTQPWGGMPGNASLEIKEVWSLSSDGKVLTVTTYRNTPALQNNFKTVYNKK
jgi:hypothetical protein